MRTIFYYILAVLCIGLTSCKTENKNKTESLEQESEVKSVDVKKILVKKLDVNVEDIESISEALSNLPSENIDVVNWPEEYPSRPEVAFRIAHNGENILLQYQVKEDEIMALVTEDNGKVWTDSAVEFFISFDGDHYYNAEFNCIGTALLGYKTADSAAEHLSQEDMKSIQRFSTLGSQKIEKQQGDFDWTLTLVIPKSVYWKTDIKTFDGITARGNFYKCGDNLTKPHYVSWTKIDTPSPSFHQPIFFGELEFEK